MFLVKVYLAQSKIHGIGLFANQSVKKGSIVYKANSKLDLFLTTSQFKKLESKEQAFIAHYGYFDKTLGKWHLAHDDIRFCNHSTSPNLTLEKGTLIALRDIRIGEELLQNYSDFEVLRSALRK